MAGAVKFIRKNGRVIPIAAGAAGAGAAALKGAKAATSARRVIKGAAGAAVHGKIKKQPIKINRALDLGGLGLSIASGVIGAATFSSGAKGFIGGALAGHGIDAAGIAANAASVAGKGQSKERAKQFAKQEGRNLLIGNAIFAAGVVGSSKNRATLVSAGAKVLAFARKALKVV